MTERDVFEGRLRAALLRHVANGPTDFDALGFARAVAAKEPRRRGFAAALAWRGLAVPGVAWTLLLLAALLAALIGGALLVGSQQRRLPAVLPPVGQVFECPPGSTPDKPGPVGQAAPLGYLKVAFDRDSARIVALVGRFDGGSGSSETWTFDVCTNRWARARPDREPAVVASREMQLVHDGDSDLTIAIGSDGHPWVYDLEANSWTAKRDWISRGDYPATASFRLAFDPVSGLVFAQVISAGDSPAPPQDLWTYDVETDTWDRVRQAGDVPPGTSGDHLLLTYDASVDRIVAVGAGMHRFSRLLDPRTGVWTTGLGGPAFNTGYWASGGEIAYDEARLRTVVFSDGLVGAYDATADRWETLYGSSTFPETGPQNRLLPELVYDPVNERLVVAGGEYRTADGLVLADDVWAFDPAPRTWTQLVAPSRIERYDAATERWIELPVPSQR